MAWILDEYSKFHGYSPAVVTGKPTVSVSQSSNAALCLYSKFILNFLNLYIRISVDLLEEMQQPEEGYFLEQRLYLRNMGRASPVNDM